MTRPSQWLFVASLALLPGCGSTVDEVCSDISDECERSINTSACRRDGGDLEELAENVGCEQIFEDHLDCLAEAVCDWEQRCATTLDELQRCVTRL